MSVQIEDSADYLYTLTEPVTEPPLTISCWCKASGATFDNGTIVTIETPDVAGYNVLGAIQNSGDVANDPVRALTYNGTDYGVAVTSTSVTNSTWHHYCCTFTSTASRAAFLDGAGKGVNTDTRVATPSELMIHGQRRNSRLAEFNDYTPPVYIAEVAIWNAGLSDADVALLAAGTNPLNVDDGNLVAYWPLLTDSADDIGSNDLTEIDFGGGSLTFNAGEHPSIDEAAEYTDITGTIAGGSSLSGDLTLGTVILMTGTLSGAGALAGNVLLKDEEIFIISSNWQTSTFSSVKKIVVVGNDSLYYEDI